MLYLYNLQRKKISALENAYDIIENQKINQIYSLSFKMLKNDLKSEQIEPFYFVRWESKEETSDFYQIIKKNLNYSNIDSLTFECQHVINLLSQKSLPTQTISGTISQCINKILSYQSDWKLISSDFSQSFIYFFEKENLLSALYSIPDTIDDNYFFDFDTSSYPYKLYLKKINLNKKPDLYIRPETNRQSAVQNVDYSQIITQIRGYGQGEGENQLKTDIIKADNAHISKYGIREKIIVDRRFTNKETLTAYCRSILRQYQDPIISYDMTII